MRHAGQAPVEYGSISSCTKTESTTLEKSKLIRQQATCEPNTFCEESEICAIRNDYSKDYNNDEDTIIMTAIVEPSIETPPLNSQPPSI